MRGSRRVGPLGTLAEALRQLAPMRFALGVPRQLGHQFTVRRVLLKFLFQVHGKRFHLFLDRNFWNSKQGRVRAQPSAGHARTRPDQRVG